MNESIYILYDKPIGVNGHSDDLMALIEYHSVSVSNQQKADYPQQEAYQTVLLIPSRT